MGRPSLRRRKFFIKKEFQSKFIATYALAVVLLAGATTFVLNSWLHRIVDKQLYSSHMKIQRTGELFLGPLIQTNMLSMLAITLVVLIFSVVLFRRLNHHFLTLDSCFNGMAQGNFATPELTSSHIVEINHLINMVQDCRAKYREQLTLLSAAMSEIESGCHGEGDPILLQSGRNRLSEIVSHIQLPQPK